MKEFSEITTALFLPLLSLGSLLQHALGMPVWPGTAPHTPQRAQGHMKPRPHPPTLLQGTFLHTCSMPGAPEFGTKEPSSAVTQTACERDGKEKEKRRGKSVTEVNPSKPMTRPLF